MPYPPIVISGNPTNLHPLSLHDALPICAGRGRPGPYGHADVALRGALGRRAVGVHGPDDAEPVRTAGDGDRKSTRLNSSHMKISYAVFRLKKKKATRHNRHLRAPTHRTR